MTAKTPKKTKPEVGTFLPGIAKEINARLEKAAQIIGKADDHRLSAALKLEEARQKCKAERVNFKKWCETNVKHAYETVRKLVRVGGAPDPKLALEDLRGGVKKAMKKTRAKKRTAAADPVAVAETAIATMEDDAAAKFIAGQVKKRNVAVDAKAKGSGDPLADAIFAFDALDQSRQLLLLAHVAAKLAATVTIFDQPLDKLIAAGSAPAQPTGTRRRRRVA